ncbi:MAG: hypothetical protein HXS41_08210 [Theionarchaea archaeon]|nr:hypothetical protein [Theionarchaea archaeon]MBU7000667.1 hypothetical protein [Theionarchaea archaeon]MBU7021029.1 hypothetical protein [Theionarchaea archaeon]
MVDIIEFISLVIEFSLTILYSFAYLEILFVFYKIFYKEKLKPSSEFLSSLFCVCLLFFAASYVAKSFIWYDIRFELFLLSLGMFFSSVALFALGLTIREMWEKKVKEMNIKLLSVYSLWIIQLIYLVAVIICFLLALVLLLLFVGDILVPLP